MGAVRGRRRRAHTNPYGITQFVYGSAVTSLIAMVLAVPVAVAVSLFITDLAPSWLRGPLSGLVDLLSITTSILGQGATMPSVIANEFTEAAEPFHLQSLMVVAGWLLVVALVVNIVEKFVVRRTGEDIA